MNTVFYYEFSAPLIYSLGSFTVGLATFMSLLLLTVYVKNLFQKTSSGAVRVVFFIWIGIVSSGALGAFLAAFFERVDFDIIQRTGKHFVVSHSLRVWEERSFDLSDIKRLEGGWYQVLAYRKHCRNLLIYLKDGSILKSPCIPTKRARDFAAAAGLRGEKALNDYMAKPDKWSPKPWSTPLKTVLYYSFLAGVGIYVLVMFIILGFWALIHFAGNRNEGGL